MPLLANTPKAVAMSVILTSPPPRVSERPYCEGSSHEFIPIFRANCMKFSTSLSASTFTAGML